MFKFLRIICTILSALCIAFFPFAWLFFGLDVALVVLGAAALLFLLVLIFKKKQEESEE
ncbi:MAG: hypothetical protein J5993_05955 [Clostridia bacterium]|nr:hypothetical protein [Clostridia bacterium]